MNEAPAVVSQAQAGAALPRAAGLDPVLANTAPPVVRQAWPRRLADAVSVYLPLLLMALLALGTWWLVKNTPLFENARTRAPLRHEPDYTMTGFLLQRFARDGTMRVQLEGQLMRHYPDTETIEIDAPRIREVAEDGRVTLATAKQALSNKDGSEVQLSGDAHVTRLPTPGESAVEFRSNFLHYFQATEQVRTHLPVVMTQGGTEIHADAMTYDSIGRAAGFSGRIRAVLPARAPAR